MNHYLDHAATTSMLPEVAAAVSEAMGQAANPSSLHASGRMARRLVEESRERLAAALGCRPGEVIFTSGGTEADNLAIKGGWHARQGPDRSRPRLVVSTIEHHAVLDPAQALVADGAEIVFGEVDALGCLNLDSLDAVLAVDSDGVGMISVMWANNEVGTLQPIGEVVRRAQQHGIPVHTDAVQAIGQEPIDFASSGVDALTLTGHKIGGPGGSGALIARRDFAMVPLLHGGGQERDVRSGTINVAGALGLSLAVEAAVDAQEEHAARMTALRERLVAGVLKKVPDARENGDPVRRLPGNAHLLFPGCEGDALLMLLDARGIECSTGSACSAGIPQASHVLLAMGIDEKAARSALRFSFGHTSVEADVDAVIEAIGDVVERARAARNHR